MICIYDKKNTRGNFKTNGFGVLDEVLSCFITEELNRDYEFELEYPAKHIFYDLRYYFIEDSRAVNCSVKCCRNTYRNTTG